MISSSASAKASEFEICGSWWPPANVAVDDGVECRYEPLAGVNARDRVEQRQQ
jgi:hypothetical protein